MAGMLRFALVSTAAVAAVILLLFGLNNYKSAPAWVAAAPPGAFTGFIPPLEPACRLKDLPPNFEYDGVGIYRGQPTDPGTERHLAGQKFVGAVTVKVTSTRRPVVLLLTGFEATIWTVEATPGVKIAGIAYTGIRPGVVRGAIPNGIPVIDLTRDSACGKWGTAAHSGDSFRRLQGLAIAAAGTRLSTFQGSYDGIAFIVGPGARHLSDLSKIRAKVARYLYWSPESEEIRKLIGAGAIRRATADEIVAWESADPELAAYGLALTPPFGDNAYMILKPFTFPAGMTGADSATFILPKGLPMPKGDIGHNRIWKMDASDGCIAIEPAQPCVKP